MKSWRLRLFAALLGLFAILATAGPAAAARRAHHPRHPHHHHRHGHGHRHRRG